MKEKSFLITSLLLIEKLEKFSFFTARDLFIIAKTFLGKLLRYETLTSTTLKKSFKKEITKVNFFAEVTTCEKYFPTCKLVSKPNRLEPSH